MAFSSGDLRGLNLTCNLNLTCEFLDIYKCYKIFTGMIGNCIKDHGARHDIWDRSQLGTVDQLTTERAKMDEAKGQQRNLAVAFYDYPKAYDMVKHDLMIRVYQWTGVPEKLIGVIKKLTKGWKTKVEVKEN